MTKRVSRAASVGLMALCAAGALAAAPVAAASAPTIANQPVQLLRGATRNTGWSSLNWSGYAETTTTPYTQIQDSWKVPSVSTSSKPTYSSVWIGIDGFTNSDLIQTGTEEDYYGGKAHYDAWWEILPAPETVIPSITVKPGNRMTAGITQLSGTSWQITIKDDTTGKSFTTDQSYSGPGASAEFIVERPEVGGTLSSLAHYSSPVTIDPGTTNTGNPHLTTSESGEMTNSLGKVISIPSVPDSDSDGFNCSYGSVAPPPPKS